MEKKDYIPCPIDLKNVALPDDLISLSEEIAKNVHEVWAQKRFNEGWTYGPERNDERKTHPGLIPYEELSEIEKEYDRATAMETLKLITKLGFEITKCKAKN